MNYEAFVAVFCLGEGHFRQAMCASAVCACEMGVALRFRAIVGQFVVLCSVLEECFVHEACSYEALESSVDCDFVESRRDKVVCDLSVREGALRFGQGLYHG